MAEFSPTWTDIIAVMATALAGTGLTQVSDRYPINKIARQDLPWAVITQPTLARNRLTFGVFEIIYTGTIDIPVIALPEDQMELGDADAETIRDLGLVIEVTADQNRALIVSGKRAHWNMGEARTVRLTPTAGGHYAGMEIPYTVRMQYRSRA